MDSMSPVVVLTDWHALDARAVADLLDVDPKSGLTTSEVSQRQLLYGRNALIRAQLHYSR